MSTSGANTLAPTGSIDASAGKFTPPTTTVASLPSAASNAHRIYVVTDGVTAEDCVTGGGSIRSLCVSTGSAWISLGGGDMSTDSVSALTSSGEIDASLGKFQFPRATVATLPDAATNVFRVYQVTDAVAAGDCTTGGGGQDTLCFSNGSWVSLGDGGSGGGSWGSITGTLADQTDLQTALDAKQARGYTSVSYSTTPTFSAASAFAFVITLTGNVSSSTFSSPATGQLYVFRICQDGTGGRTFAWPTGFTLATPIASTASSCSNQAFVWTGSAAAPINGMYISDVSGATIEFPHSTSGRTVLQASATTGDVDIDLPATSGTLAKLTDTVAKATELETNPSACPMGDFVTDIDADGTLTCDTPAGGGSWTMPYFNFVTRTGGGTFYHISTDSTGIWAGGTTDPWSFIHLDDDGTEAIVLAFPITGPFSSGADVNATLYVLGETNAATYGASVEIGCSGHGDTGSSYNSASTGSVAVTANLSVMTVSGIDATGCATGKIMRVRIKRNTGDTPTNVLGIAGAAFAQ